MKGGELTMKSFRRVTEKDFNQIKKLFAMKLSYGMVSDLTGRAPSTLRIVKDADSFEDYKRGINAFYAKYKKPKNVSLPGESKQVEDAVTASSSEIIDVLLRIENLLERHLGVQSNGKVEKKPMFWNIKNVTG